MSIDILNNIVVPVEFSCSIINDRLILGNSYSITLLISPEYQAKSDIGIGFQRIKHFTANYLQDSIFVNKTHKLAKELEEFENNVVFLPCDPYDFYIGCILLAKFTVITKKYFDIDYLTIDSTVGDRVQYGISDPTDCGFDIDGDFWWNSDSVSTGHRTIVTWDELNLTQVPTFQPTIVQGGLSDRK
jgi:hypothetical protein